MKISVHIQTDLDGNPVRYGLRFADGEEDIQIIWLHSREELLQTSLAIQEALSKS